MTKKMLLFLFKTFFWEIGCQNSMLLYHVQFIEGGRAKLIGMIEKKMEPWNCPGKSKLLRCGRSHSKSLL